MSLRDSHSERRVVCELEAVIPLEMSVAERHDLQGRGRTGWHVFEPTGVGQRKRFLRRGHWRDNLLCGGTQIAQSSILCHARFSAVRSRMRTP